MSQKAFNIIFLILISGAIIIGIVALIKALNPKFLPNPDGTPSDGLGGALANILSQAPTWLGNLFGSQCDPKKLGYTKDGKYNPTKCGYGTLNCDPNRKGYEIDGTPNILCGKDYTGCDVLKCDASRYGYNECGFPDINCGFGG